MRKPLPWSYSALDDFINCPRAYSEKRVFKTVQEPQSEQMLYGNYVHKAFENRIKHGSALPPDLMQHERYMQQLESDGRELFTERKIALNTKAQPCSFFDRGVWFRGVIDFTALGETNAKVIDYKTGKEHQKFAQLKLFALWLFAKHPELEKVHCEFYWTKTKTTTGEMYYREQIDQLWATFLPNLRQYVEAFKTDTWQPRQSGLCNGWCPVTDCEFWRPKKQRR